MWCHFCRKSVTHVCIVTFNRSPTRATPTVLCWLNLKIILYCFIKNHLILWGKSVPSQCYYGHYESFLYAVAAFMYVKATHHCIARRRRRVDVNDAQRRRLEVQSGRRAGTAGAQAAGGGRAGATAERACGQTVPKGRRQLVVAAGAATAEPVRGLGAASARGTRRRSGHAAARTRTEGGRVGSRRRRWLEQGGANGGGRLCPGKLVVVVFSVRRSPLPAAAVLGSSALCECRGEATCCCSGSGRSSGWWVGGASYPLTDWICERTGEGLDQTSCSTSLTTTTLTA
jgi:hypothetical protein